MAQQQHQCDNNSGYGVLPFQSGLMLKKRILEAVHSVYRDADDDTDCGVTTAADESSYQPRMLSLPHIGAAVGVHVSETARKATVMVIGNVSAGKSTFVNWYTNSSIQKTGMAIETNGFTIVTCGDSYNELGGESTAVLYPHLQETIKRHKLYEHICTKTCPSKTLKEENNNNNKYKVILPKPANEESREGEVGGLTTTTSGGGVMSSDDSLKTTTTTTTNNYNQDAASNINGVVAAVVDSKLCTADVSKISTTTTKTNNQQDQMQQQQQQTTKHEDIKQQTNKHKQQHTRGSDEQHQASSSRKHTHNTHDNNTTTTTTTNNNNINCSRDLLLQVVDIIDTPGLSDGDLSYDFDVVKVIEELSRHADLVLVFFEPVCQALGRTLLELSSRLCSLFPEKLLFCVTKVDAINTEQERIKVMCQTTQSLTSKIPCRHGFDLIPIFVPGATDGSYLNRQQQHENKRCRDGPVNRIHDVVEETQRLVDRKVEQSLSQLKADCHTIETKVRSLIAEDETKQKINRKGNTKLWTLRFWSLIGFLLFAIVGFVHILCVLSLPLSLEDQGYVQTMDYLGLPVDLPKQMQRQFKEIYWTFPHIFALSYLMVAMLQLWLFYLQRYIEDEAVVLTAKQLQALNDKLTFIRNVNSRGRKLYRNFLHNTADFGATAQTHKHN
eukprot:GHVS01091439.1.p1 GENE.GHVS01091439.1~~GHVS01091439.1.p1  ORF type:complete len:668 (+),score=156.27 GHVS01091439.1:208-2211(+)